MCWLFGGWNRVSAMGGHFSDLEIDSDDVFALMFETMHCPIVMIQLNYLDRVAHRNLIVNTNQHVFEIDFINKTFHKDNNLESFDFERNHSYRMQHKAIIENNYKYLCTFDFAKDVLHLITAAEESAYLKDQNWINNEKSL